MPRLDSPLPYGRHVIEEDDIAAVLSVLRSDWLTTGPAVKSFELAFAAKVGARFAVACNSGTAGLHLAALALGLGAGDTVIVPSNTFVATANAVRYVGGTVRLADVDPRDGLLTATTTRAALADITTPAKAVFPVHFAGRPVDLEAIAAIAAEEGLAVVEDACHALGSSYRTSAGSIHPIGACHHSAMAVFSMHPVKTITMGEGGVVTTNDENLYQRLCHFRSHGIARDPALFQNPEAAYDISGAVNPWYYEAQDLGFNYRASDINCALGESQLGKLDRFVARRRLLVDCYQRQLTPLAPWIVPVSGVADELAALHLMVVCIDFSALQKTRAAVMRSLLEQGVGSQVHYIPVHRQPAYAETGLSLPGADRYYQSCLSVPLFPTMTPEDVDHVVSVFAGLVEQAGLPQSPRGES